MLIVLKRAFWVCVISDDSMNIFPTAWIKSHLNNARVTHSFKLYSCCFMASINTLHCCYITNEHITNKCYSDWVSNSNSTNSSDQTRLNRVWAAFMVAAPPSYRVVAAPRKSHTRASLHSWKWSQIEYMQMGKYKQKMVNRNTRCGVFTGVQQSAVNVFGTIGLLVRRFPWLLLASERS